MRFPADFMFQLSADEKADVIANCDHLGKLKFSSQRPYAFTEHRAIMAANVLSSEQAVEVSVFMVRAVVNLRQWMATHSELAAKLAELDRKVSGHDERFANWSPPCAN